MAKIDGLGDLFVIRDIINSSKKELNSNRPNKKDPHYLENLKEHRNIETLVINYEIELRDLEDLISVLPINCDNLTCVNKDFFESTTQELKEGDYVTITSGCYLGLAKIVTGKKPTYLLFTRPVPEYKPLNRSS